jgi:hypothetical protein
MSERDGNSAELKGAIEEEVEEVEEEVREEGGAEVKT